MIITEGISIEGDNLIIDMNKIFYEGKEGYDIASFCTNFIVSNGDPYNVRIEKDYHLLNQMKEDW